MSIDTVFNPPQPTDPLDTFNTKAFDTVAKLNAWSAEANALAVDVNEDAADAEQSAVTAAAQRVLAQAAASGAQVAAISAAQSAGAAAWAAGNYVTGSVAYSPISSLSYRRKAPGGASPTDPANDPTNWSLAIIAAPLYRPETGASVIAEVNVDHGLRYAGAQELIVPAVLAVGDVFWLRVENGRVDNFLNLNGHKVNGEIAATPLVLDDPFAALCARYTGASYGLSI